MNVNITVNSKHIRSTTAVNNPWYSPGDKQTVAGAGDTLLAPINISSLDS